MDSWLFALLVATSVGAISFCLLYFISLLSRGSADLRTFENLARRAFYRSSVPFTLALLIVRFNPALISKLNRFFPGGVQRGLSNNGQIRVWVNTKSGFYYCPDAKNYGKLGPGTYMTEANAVQSGYQPILRQACR